MASFEQRRRDRLEKLKVAKEEVLKSMWEPQKRAPPGSLRIAVYNVLADAMSDDGFLVRPILADWPAGRDLVPTKDGDPVPFHQLLADMLAAKGNVDALQQCQTKYNLPKSKDNTHATVDWKARLSQMMCFLECFCPDILVFTEVDHYDDFLDSLRELGYVSQLPGSTSKYRPAHLDSFSDTTPEKARHFQQEWDARGFAFLPHLASISMHVYMQNTGLGKRILEAAAKTKDPSLAQKIKDPKKDLLSRKWYQQLPPGASRVLLEQAGYKEPERLDDMGVAIFWKDRRLVATELRTHTYPGGGKGFIQVKLQDRRSPGSSLVVMGTHLSSGDSPKDEEERLTCELACEGGLIQAIEAVRASGENLVVCMDANSDPASRPATSKASCWQELHRATGASVWDGFYDANGVYIDPGKGPKGPKESLEKPVTTNKVRGPQSAQAKKIGNHAYSAIDHIFYTPGNLSFHEHVYQPRQFPNEERALEEVLPSLKDPSDHYPVIADLMWQTGGAGAAGAPYPQKVDPKPKGPKS
ncbi:unnamed protein product [Symbiodinium natans]|uniref:Nocturnin n=1 Tax=Symbiodinium natans TaxID=878477 RepID=A0A812UH48_9DINO|nr:unnamed protein product [Symbiodinium natans]